MVPGMHGAQGRKDAPRYLQDNEQWLREQIESLRTVHEHAKVALQQLGARQTLFLQAAQDIADRQKAFAKHLEEDAANNTAALGAAPRGSETGDGEVVVFEPAGAGPEAQSDVGGDAPSERTTWTTGRASGLSPSPSSLSYEMDNRTRSSLSGILEADDVELQSSGPEQNRSRMSWANNVSLKMATPAPWLRGPSNQIFPTPAEVGLYEWARLATGSVLHAPFFEYLIALIVVANAVCIGVEIDMDLRGEDVSTVMILEYVFVSIYVVEMGMHFFVDGIGCLRDGLVLFEFILVVVGCIGVYFGQHLIALLRKVGAADATPSVDQLFLFRMVRLFRLARALRMLSLFKNLWNLVVGFLHSLKTLASTALFLTLVIYVFACLGIHLITKDEKLREDAVAEMIVDIFFSNLLRFMLTLIQFVTMDNISEIYYPLIMLRPALFVYFAALLMILSICMMNLITGLIVEKALARTAKDTEIQARARRKKMKKMMPAMREVFRALNQSGNGVLRIGEIVHARSIQGILDVVKAARKKIPKEMHNVLTRERLLDMFEFLDLDESGDLDENEFVRGMCHFAMAEVPWETLQLLQMARQQRREIAMLRSDVHEVKVGAVVPAMAI